MAGPSYRSRSQSYAPGRDLLQSGSWTWEEVLNGNLKNGAVPVTAFLFQKEPLAPYWDHIVFPGIIGELDLNSTLRYPDHGHSSKKKKEKAAVYYWVVEVIASEGYFLKVRYLGFPPELADEVRDHERWIHFSQLKGFGYYKENGGIPQIPQIPGHDALNEDEVLEWLYKVVGRHTINPRCSEFVNEAEKNIKWNIGTKVEVRNRDCCNEVLPGSVSQLIGHRVEVLYSNIPSRIRSSLDCEGFWIHKDSDLIKPQGWAKIAGAKLGPLITNKSKASRKQSLDRILQPPDESVVDLGIDLELSASVNIQVGMLFEFINPLKLNNIALGKVTKVLGHGYFNCCIESEVSKVDLVSYTKGMNEFHYHISSKQLFPLATFENEMPPPVPQGIMDGGAFEWERYLKKTGKKALQLPPRDEENLDVFKEGMWLEIADTHRPELICPAIIHQVCHPYAMKIRFLGWDSDFDQWKPMKSLEMFPIGWCQLKGFPLELPRTEPNIELNDSNETTANPSRSKEYVKSKKTQERPIQVQKRSKSAAAAITKRKR